MANRTVSIFYSVRVNGQHHRLKPVLGKNHKIRPEWAVFKGTDTHLPGGSYVLGWYEGPRRVWRDVGPNPQDAIEAADRQRVSLAAVRVGLPIQKTDDASLLLQTAVASYLEEYRLMRSDESLQLVRHTLNDFVSHCKRIYLKDVTRMDLLKFADWLQKVKKNAPRTANRQLTEARSEWERHYRFSSYCGFAYSGSASFWDGDVGVSVFSPPPEW